MARAASRNDAGRNTALKAEEVFDVLVIGGGPAGMCAAIAASRAGARVLLCEQLPAAGTRLLATGGGRCNLTNTLEPDAFMDRCGRHGRFMAPALRCLSRDGLLQFMSGRGVPCCAEDGRHYFPCSGRSSHVRDALLGALRASDGAIRCGVAARCIRSEKGSVRSVEFGEHAAATGAVVLATGGCSYPELGGGDTGYRMARDLGHKVVTPVPALVGLVTRESWPGECAGITLASAAVRTGMGGRSRTTASGPVLFTHQGVSGPAVLDVSGCVARALLTARSVTVTVSPEPSETVDSWGARMDGWAVDSGRKSVRSLVARHLPGRLSLVACEQAGIADATTAARLPRVQRQRLSEWLAAIPLTICGTEGMERAMVTSGGIALSEVDPATLESRIVQGLFFAGEVLDLDGPCGGFNLQWAFSSGWLAGTSAARCALEGT